tara:strand:+ start:133 stop:855 length:723 start_codon:yes stop_codon:yes gene_type:complete
VSKIIIPARLNSKRLPRKPLIDINGLPMIIKTALNATEAVGSDNVFVATDSQEIINCCNSHNVNSILTSESCLTGTDRVIEAAKKLSLKKIYNLQGDEPLFPSKIIKKFISETCDSEYPVDMGITRVKNINELKSPKIPKVVFNNKKELMYTSRSNIPGAKNMDNVIGFKQVCIYKYNIEKLSKYIINESKTFFESIEDLELLRMLELDISVKCRYLNYQDHFSIDTPEDLFNLKKFLKK